MKFIPLLPALLALAFMIPLQGRAESGDDLSKWDVVGDIEVDRAKTGPGAGPSIAIQPDSSAFLKLRDTDDSGSLVLDVFDDGTVANSTPKYRSVGPRWGFQLADGRVFVVGIYYTPFVDKNGSYCIVESNGEEAYPNWDAPQFLAPRGAAGWKEWRLNFDADNGFSVTLDGKPTSKSFKWDKTKANGFAGLALYGDSTPAKLGQRQSIWVRNIDYQLDEPMNVKPGE